MKLGIESIRVAVDPQAWFWKFKEAWDSKTIYYSGGWEDEDEYLKDYRGVDYSKDNIFTRENHNPRSRNRYVFSVGAPYRKEVSPDDSLGTYRYVSFVVNPDSTISIDRNEYYASAVNINGHSLAELEEEKIPLMRILPDPTKLDVYNGVGMKY